ncbi:hypothetical protein D3C72_1842460 [compost metagenome]
MAALQFAHQPGHRLGLRGHAAAHVIVDTGSVRHFGQRGVQTLSEFRHWGAGMPSVGAGSRIHRHVQDDRLAGLMGLAGKRTGMRGIRHDRHGYRAGQGQGTAITRAALAQVVDDYAHVRLARLGGCRECGAAQQVQQGT